ncbi:hypothetical protein GOFOIKOB_2864 [Methylobacterium tardum]|nr:hypothetical protein GOFOIKOB_2864 [Methylobacterium tardum]
MTMDPRRLVADALPPLTLTSASTCRSQQANPMPRLGRIACVLAALALPAIGIAVADTVHRGIGPKAPQAAAPVTPSDGAAVPSGTVTVTPARALRAMRTAATSVRPGEIRS